MKSKIKFTDAALSETVISPFLTKCKNIGQSWNQIVKQLEECCIEKLDGSGITIDPFRLGKILQGLKTRKEMVNAIDNSEILALEGWLSAERGLIINTFEERLKTFLEKKEFNFMGHFPRYVLEGFLNLEIDQNEGVCVLGRHQFNTLSIDFIAPQIEKILMEEKKREFNPSAFLNEMYMAYLKAAIAKKTPTGEAISVRELFVELAVVRQPIRFRKNPVKANYLEYSEEMFSRDLGKLMKSSLYITNDGYRLEFTPTSFSAEGIAVLDTHTGSARYLGRVVFRKERTVDG
jgi:hypothetical protein